MADNKDRKSVITSENPFWIWIDVTAILLNPIGLSDEAFFRFFFCDEWNTIHSTAVFSQNCIRRATHPFLHQPNFLSMRSPKHPLCFYLAVVIWTSSTQHRTMLHGMRYITAYRQHSSIQAATKSVAGDFFFHNNFLFVWSFSYKVKLLPCKPRWHTSFIKK